MEFAVPNEFILLVIGDDWLISKQSCMGHNFCGRSLRHFELFW